MLCHADCDEDRNWRLRPGGICEDCCGSIRLLNVMGECRTFDEPDTKDPALRSGTRQLIDSRVSHVLKPGFQKVRYDGFTSASRRDRFEHVRSPATLAKSKVYELASLPAQPEPAAPPSCPKCGTAMTLVAILQRSVVLTALVPQPAIIDTSQDVRNGDDVTLTFEKLLLRRAAQAMSLSVRTDYAESRQNTNKTSQNRSP